MNTTFSGAKKGGEHGLWGYMKREEKEEEEEKRRRDQEQRYIWARAYKQIYFRSGQATDLIRKWREKKKELTSAGLEPATSTALFM